MRIAILSDTHDDLPRLIAAMAVIDALKPDAILHLGDICSPSMLPPLANRSATIIFGNNDFEQDKLRETARTLNIACLDNHGTLTISGKTIGLLHGHDPRPQESMLAAGAHYLFSGHTHVRHDFRLGATRMINPGALHRAKEKTFAILDLDTDTLTIHHV